MLINADLLIDVIVYSFIPLGLWISLRVMKYPDLAIEQLFVLGGVIFALQNTESSNTVSSIITISLVALILGVIVSFAMFYIRINPIVLSLIMGYIYFSASLFAMDKPNILINTEILNPSNLSYFISIILVISILFIHFIFKSNAGKKIIATGCNKDLCENLRISTFFYGALGFSLSFALVLIGGALYTIRTSNADISYGAGQLLMAIFVVLTTRLLNQRINFLRNAITAIIITFIYSIILQFIISLNFPTELTRGFYAIMLLVLVLLIPKKNIKLF